MPEAAASPPVPAPNTLLDRLRAMEVARSAIHHAGRDGRPLGAGGGARDAAQTLDAPGRAHYETVMRMTLAIDLRDHFTGAHSLRTGRAARLLARALGCDDGFCWRMELAAPMHDIGMIGVPDHILMMPTRLSDEQRRLVETHCDMGALLLSSADSPELRLAREIAQSHHERWDGWGYPRRLKGEAIPLSGQIVAIVDTFDALASERPYRETMPVDLVVDFIDAERGHAYSPALVDAFVPLVPSIIDEGRKIAAALQLQR